MNSGKFLAPALWGLLLLFPIAFNCATPRRSHRANAVEGRRIRIDRAHRVLGGDIRQAPPLVYQEIGGRRQQVSGRYVLRGEGAVVFEIADSSMQGTSAGPIATRAKVLR